MKIVGDAAAGVCNLTQSPPWCGLALAGLLAMHSFGAAADTAASPQGKADSAPFTLEGSIVMPEVPSGPYSDYLATDVGGSRLFATPQASHAVAVIDLRAFRLLTLVQGLGNPHAVFYDPQSHQLFVSDGEAGAVKVFDGADFKLVKTVTLAAGVDGMSYDPTTRLLYVNNGGKDARLDHSFVSVIDTATATKVADIRIDAGALEASVIDPVTQRLYVNLVDRNSVAVVDLKTRTVVADWTLQRSHRNMAMALDADHQRLYIGCRDGDMHGSIEVLDLKGGQELDGLPIGGWVDSMYYDARRQRIYSSEGTGELETFQVLSDGKYRKLESVDTAVMAKTSIYDPQLDRMFVSVPHLGGTPAKILVFRPTP